MRALYCCVFMLRIMEPMTLVHTHTTAQQSEALEIFDVALIGMGPAGSICARALDSRALRVIAFDRKPLDPAVEQSFHKPCGGLLAPDAQKVLAQLELNLPKEVLVDPQIFSVVTLDCAQDYERTYQRMYINVDRQKFDCWLMREAAAGVTLKSHTAVTNVERAKLEDGTSGYRVTYRPIIAAHQTSAEQIAEAQQASAEQTTTIFARTLVGADGAHSSVRKMLYPHAKIRTYTSIQQWFKEEHPLPFYSCVFDPAITDCYSWGISKDGFFIFGGAYPQKKARALFEKQKEKLARKGYRFGDVVKTESCQVLRPQKWSDFYTGKDCALLVGEAGGFISASSLEGISSALISGVHAAQCINEHYAHGTALEKSYAASMRRQRMRLLAKVFKCPFMYWPPLRNIIMKSGLNALKKR